MSFREESNETIRAEAAAWTTLIDGGDMTEAQLQNFHAWVAEPRNARELSECRSMVVMIQDLPREKAAHLVALHIPYARFPALTQFFSSPLRVSAAALAALAVVAVGLWEGVPSIRETITHSYSTGTGETRTVVLNDGSIAHLNTQSRIRWSGSGKDRHVLLEKGEVLFEVAHDATRPFRVTVGNSEIRDLATEFDVYRKSNGSVVVTVLSGQVAIKELAVAGAQPVWTERQLKSNEQIEYTQANLIADVHSVTAPKAVRWREGLLETEKQPFATVVSELNRYSSKPILTADPRLDAANINIGGTLGIHDVPAALERIQRVAPVVVTDTGDSYVLTYKADVSPLPENAAGHP